MPSSTCCSGGTARSPAAANAAAYGPGTDPAAQVCLQRVQVEPGELHVPPFYPGRVIEPACAEFSVHSLGGAQVRRVKEPARVTALPERRELRRHDLDQGIDSWEAGHNMDSPSGRQFEDLAQSNTKFKPLRFA
jgi:hypothetical protein